MDNIIQAIFIGGIVVIGIGLLLLYFISRKLKVFGILSGKLVYNDSTIQLAEVLYAKTLPLCGKPDYIIKEGKQFIPVEVKTGKTPSSAYLNHTMQLMAYCLIVQEHFGIRPSGGYLRYPQKEFKIAYTKEAEQSIRTLVEEIGRCKKQNYEIHCTHKEHYYP